MGMLINTIPCVVRMNDKDMTIKDLIESIHQDYINMIPYSHCGLREIQNWNDIQGDQKLIRTNVVFENLPTSNEQVVEKEQLLESVRGNIDTGNFNDFDIQVVLFPSQTKLSGEINYNVKEVDSNIIQQITNHFKQTFNNIVECLEKQNERIIFPGKSRF